VDRGFPGGSQGNFHSIAQQGGYGLFPVKAGLDEPVLE
jgi:hypothetical protein